MAEYGFSPDIDIQSVVPRPSQEIFQEVIEIDPNDETGISTLLAAKQGYLVGRIGDQFLRLNTDVHLATTGPTGSGKGVGVIVPNLIDHPGSALVIDIRGETVARTAAAQRLKGNKVVILDPFDITKGKWGRDTYNPLDPFIDKRDALDADGTLDRIANALLFDDKGRHSTEPIWDNSTLSILKGLMYLCLNFWPPEKQNLTEVYRILASGQEVQENFIRETLKIASSKDIDLTAELRLKQVVEFFTSDRSKTKIPDNAIVQAKLNLEWSSGRAFIKDIKKSSFSFEDLSKQKTTIYVVVPEEHITHCGVWLRLILESAVFAIPDIVNTTGGNTKEMSQEDRVLFLLDEFPALGKVDVIAKGMTTLRGRGINLWLLIQNLAQLDDIYGEQGARVIMGNLALLQAFESREIGELEYFIRLVGETMFDVQTVTMGETITEGKTVTSTQTRSFTNSENFSKSKGTADTVSEARGTNWSKNRNRSWNSSDTSTWGENKGRTGGRSKSDQSGKGRSKGSTWNRNLLSFINPVFGGNLSDNRGSNESSSKQSGTTSGWSQGSNRGGSRTKGVGGSMGEQWGGSTQHTTAHTQNETETYTKGSTETLGDSSGKSTQDSYAINKQISIKQERMKIETVRSIRSKLSNRNSMICVGNESPFFVPRIKFFIKYLDRDRYMFPDMAALANIDNFGEITNRPYLQNPLDINEIYGLQTSLIEDLSIKVNDSNPKKTLKNYKTILIHKLEEVADGFKEIQEKLAEQSQQFNEAAIAMLAVICGLKRNDVDGFELLDELLIAKMAEVESASTNPGIIAEEEIAKYSSLALAQPNGRVGMALREISHSSKKWLVEQYRVPMERLTHLIKGERDKLKQQLATQELTREFLITSFSQIEEEIENALYQSARRDIMAKHSFMAERYSSI